MEDKIEALKMASEYIVNLKISILKTVEYLQSSEYEKGLNMLASIADGLNWLSIVIENTRDVQNGKISLSELNNKLSEIVEAIEDKDNVLVGDLFQYELLPIIEKAEQIINNSITN
ncbi:hypothetical protein [Clostridium uliginosum]|uniref:DUF8042 domain-containing protein n=1 Tax=Clostridium uliginosum TaxID=119641 RepID=A0A1I1KTY3_9CLOT|nr:hypothetical protein [Clostridium uliginosum]SFC60920.1 hypothetical protein SAMN05421842_10638 [Clostridium uliginosum]